MKNYNEKKICFIICANNELQLEECLLYLNRLQVPEGYEKEVLVVEGALSMTAGYNEGMNASDAKYKVYLHQDALVIDTQFIQKLLHIFHKDKQIGVVGIIGAEHLPKDAVMWHGERCGNFYRLDKMLKEGVKDIELLKKGMREVQVVDGFLMATQYDLPWREDILKGWDFYDVSQCLEFRRAGYKIVVPAQKSCWVIHDCGVPKLWAYEANRQIILKEYPEIDSNKEQIRILFLKSKPIAFMGLVYGLLELGHDVVVPEYKVSLEKDDKDIEWVEEVLEEGHYDLVMTYDFSNSVSVACENQKVKYYAWVFDSPLVNLYSIEATNSHTFISVFDRKQYERLSKLQRIPHLYYLPLATDVGMFGTIRLNKREEKKFAAEVSFVGRLYDNIGYDNFFGDEDETLKEEAERLIHEPNCCWDGRTRLIGEATDELIEHISAKTNGAVNGEYDIDTRYYVESLQLIRRCNEVERLTILTQMSKKHQVVLYTDNVNKAGLSDVKIRPWVDYWGDMPKVFYLSKINLNITSRSIESGIPQRVWDIMAVGGFVLTNYQPELEEYFEIGKDLEVYHDLEELEQKVDYYLKHEKARVQIAINGYQKVRKYHSYKQRLQEILPRIIQEEV